MKRTSSTTAAWTGAVLAVITIASALGTYPPPQSKYAPSIADIALIEIGTNYQQSDNADETRCPVGVSLTIMPERVQVEWRPLRGDIHGCVYISDYNSLDLEKLAASQHTLTERHFEDIVAEIRKLDWNKRFTDPADMASVQNSACDDWTDALPSDHVFLELSDGRVAIYSIWRNWIDAENIVRECRRASAGDLTKVNAIIRDLNISIPEVVDRSPRCPKLRQADCA